MLLRIFGPKRDEVTGKLRKLHHEEQRSVLLTQYCSGDQIEKNDRGRACSTYERELRRIQDFVGEI
jgi:hypothetical protein